MKQEAMKSTGLKAILIKVTDKRHRRLLSQKKDLEKRFQVKMAWDVFFVLCADLCDERSFMKPKGKI
jgi:predicted protein tyrosine phosphatase